VEAEQMRRRVADARNGYLSTSRRDGRPHIVPFCFVLEGDALYSAVDAKPKRTTHLQRLENVRRRPQVSVLVDHYTEDWEQLWWVRLDGRAVVLPADAESDRALELLAAKYPQYIAQPPLGPVLRIAVERWRGWSAR
jgi:PPOX class probable F420-dependent enzyme